MDAPTGLADAVYHGLASEPHEVAEGLWACRALEGWPRLAQELSHTNPGQWHPKPKGLTWQVSRRAAWIVDPAMVRTILDAVCIVKGIGLTCGYSIGSAARALLKWIGPGQPDLSCADALFEDAEVGYHDCRPCTFPHGILWDVSSCYYRIWCRLPSLRCYVVPGEGVRWLGMERAELRRREQVADLVAAHKGLRNALYGCMLGAQAGRTYYHRGEARRAPRMPGLFRSGGLVIARAAWEVCRDGSEEVDSVYSNTDCVLSLDGAYPSIWESYGLDVTIKGEGPGEVCARGVYVCGEATTEWYGPGGLYREPVDRAPPPTTRYARGWLAA